jgi:imidazolonepropionase-like amidohydrolase
MSVAIKCGKLFDATDGKVLQNKVIRVDGSKIKEVVDLNAFKPAQGEEIYDFSDKFVMPGLIDGHVHIAFGGGLSISEVNEPAGLVAMKSLRNVQADLLAGFTTVRDLGYPTVRGSQCIRDAINQGIVWGPRIFTSGMYITQTGGHMSTTYPQDAFGQQCFKPVNSADGPYEVRAACRTMLKYGVDYLKIMVTGGVYSNSGDVGGQNMDYDEIKAAVDVAKMHHVKISCHAHGTAGIRDAARAGISSIEHCTLADDEGIDYMLKNKVLAVPTLLTFRGVMLHGKERGISDSIVAKASFLAPQHAANIRKMYDRGVRCLFGTDTGTPLMVHGQQHGEFKCMVDAGITPEDTLLGATRYCAEFMDWNDRVGTIEAGKLADIVAIDGDPLADMSVMAPQNIDFVMKDGVIYKKNGVSCKG